MSTEKPIIGIPACRKRIDPHMFHAVGEKYIAAVATAADGMPLLIPALGGSLAIGHPFAATGARILGGLAKILEERGSGRGMISICTAGGMGVTAIVEK